MSKKRVHELAKELGIDNKEIIARMEKLGIAVRSHSSTLEEADVERITRELRTKAPAEMVEKRIKSTVIRRRSVRAVSEEAADTDEATIEAVEPPPASTLPAQEPLDKPVVPKKKILDKSSALPKESREISPPPGEEAPEKSPVTAKVPPAPVVEPTLVAPPAAADEKVAKTESKAGVPEPLEKTLPEPTPLEPSIPPEQTVEQVSAQVRVEKTVEEKPAPEKTREQPAFKPEVPVRKPGVPFRAEGRKPLPEERRKLEGPKLVIPPKAAAAPETPAEVKATPEISAAPGEPPGKAEVKAAPAQPVPPPSRPQTPAPTGKKIERPEPKQTPARISGPPAPATKRPARPAAPSPPVLTPPPLEKVWKEEPVRFKGKIKKQQEALLTEKPPIKKKLIAAKLPDLTDDFDDIDLPEKPLKWREERKSPVAKAMKKTAITTPKAIKRRVKVAEAITVGELAKKMGVKASEVISKLMSLGLMVSINQPIDRDTATIVAADFGFQIEAVVDEYDDLLTQKAEVTSSNLKPRAPVVTIMGHVDHGKTSLLDAIRMTNVIDGEAGGITQAIGAYHVEIKGREIVFLDTPGHEAFTAMRARGAQVTDIVVLVVAADDGVKEQTIEAINHARVAGVPIIVAVNKIDKPGADPGKIKQSLTEYNLLAEEWGGDTIFCEVSAKKKMGIEDLLEMILLQAEIMDLKADPDRPARGVIIEAKLDRGRGPVSTVLIQEGTLREGDAFVSKTEFGRVRAMYNDQGNRVKEAGPSMPVEVIGFSGVPPVGSEFIVMEDEKKARAISEAMVRKEREKDLLSSAKITLEQLYEKIREGIKDFNVIIKGDVQGSVEALSESLRKLSDADVKLKIIHASTGAITETDVMLASASNAIIIGFNVRPDGRVAELAQQEGIEIKLYDIIYNAIADVKAAMEGSLKPVYKEVVHGRAEIRNTFRVSKVGTIAGCYVDEGKIARSYRVKLIRDGVVVYSGKIQSLKRFKDDVKEVLAGFECGLAIEGFNDLKVGDVIEAYSEEQVERSSRD